MKNKTPVSPSLFAYTDEAGNTGMNLFDSGQPEFWTGTLLCPTDLDASHPDIHASLLGRAGVSELHANELGMPGIEKIAGKIMNLLVRYKVTFLFTRVDKSDFAALKFFDTLFDSGLNDAVSPFHYGVRYSRLYFAQLVSGMTDTQNRIQFWSAYQKNDARALSDVLTNVRTTLESFNLDPRSRQILCDALEWGIVHPANLLEGRQNGLASPNIAALSLLVQLLHSLHEETGAAIVSFVHDEQQQFGRFLRQAFDINSKFSGKDFTNPLSLMADLKEMPTFVGRFVIKKSTTSLGLQLLDIALWLSKRFIADPDAIHGKSRELAILIAGRSSISEMSQRRLVEEVAAASEYIMAQPLSVTAEAEARKNLAEIEARRLERMRGLESGESIG
jgi:hypothetical protein